MDLPSGTVTLLFTDIEGSTRLLAELGEERYAAASAEHRRVLRDAAGRYGGVEVDTQGDAVLFAFGGAGSALEAARAGQTALARVGVRVRMGVHTGEPRLEREGYVGLDVHRAARICAAGHGGQVVVSDVTARLAGGDGLRDLGVVRLRDLSAPQRLYQLGDVEFAPLRCLPDTNLPVVASAFVGRREELKDLVALINAHRIVTLIGAGGSGKSRLALQAAAEVSHRHRDGVWWVPLASVRDPALVSVAVASALGSGSDLAAFLAERSMLIVLDNMEHVLFAAGEIAGLLAVAPAVHLVTTSREPLHLAGEHRYPVAPMTAADARTLFLERAIAIDPGVSSEAVDEICVRLDHLPLAIELAAARTSLLSPPALLGRLDESLQLLTAGARDMPERQRTMRATVDWSHDLLNATEQAVFRHFSLFAGGCQLEAAEEVCDTTVEVLGSLVEKSLIRRWADGRLGMLEVVREYARERLAQSGEQIAVGERHMDHYLRRAEASPGIVRWAEPAVVAEFLGEVGNLRSAVEYALENRPDAALRFGGALAGFWMSAELYADARAWLRAAPLDDPSFPNDHRLRALAAAAMLAFFAETDIDLAERLASQGLVIAAELNDRAHEVELLAAMAAAAATRGALDEAAALQLQALAIAREIGNTRLERLMLHRLGETERDQGDFTAARDHLRQSLDMSRALEDGFEGHTIHSFGDLELDAGNFTDAMRWYADSIGPDLPTRPTRRDETYAVAGIAGAAAGLGDAASAVRLWVAAEQEERAAGFRMVDLERRRYEHWAQLAASALTTEESARMRNQSSDHAWEDTIAEALAIAGSPPPTR